ncbi:MAG: hypothetical protein F6J92_34845, partial [Symploca sp. SIO1A3]|nr:hypothetical protein [Symploca sp. SIO1A3]
NHLEFIQSQTKTGTAIGKQLTKISSLIEEIETDLEYQQNVGVNNIQYLWRAFAEAFIQKLRLNVRLQWTIKDNYLTRLKLFPGQTENRYSKNSNFFDKDILQVVSQHSESKPNEIILNSLLSLIISLCDNEHILQQELISILQSDKETLQSDKETLQSDKETLQSDKEALQSDKEALQSDKEALQSDKEALQSDKEALQFELNDIKNKKVFQIFRLLYKLEYQFQKGKNIK